jgi:hypothetical protein
MQISFEVDGGLPNVDDNRRGEAKTIPRPPKNRALSTLPLLRIFSCPTPTPSCGSGSESGARFAPHGLLSLMERFGRETEARPIFSKPGGACVLDVLAGFGLSLTRRSGGASVGLVLIGDALLRRKRIVGDMKHSRLSRGAGHAQGVNVARAKCASVALVDAAVAGNETLKDTIRVSQRCSSAAAF